MSGANTLWGTPRIIGELAKLGIQVATSTVDQYRLRASKPLSPRWKSFLKNHVTDLVPIDFFIVPTIRFKLMFVLVVLAHSRRKVIHFNVRPLSGHALDPALQCAAVDGIAISKQVARRTVPREGFDDLLARGSSRSSAHRELRGRIRSWSGSSEPCVASA
jgi:hypothetical protein